MSYLIRRATRNDAAQLEQLLVAYLRETYRSAWGGSARRLESDILDGALEIIVAETDAAKLVGFIAWTLGYDLHWCLRGVVVIDFYVAPVYRGRGAALVLATAAAAEIQKRGGAFLHGGAVENEAVRRLYNRVAMAQPNGECYVSGRAFRHFACLSG